jgi:predicted nucleic acid-binding protein
MNGHRLLVDTNIFIMLLDGNERIADILEGNTVFTSFVSELELLSAQGLKIGQIRVIENLLSDCTIVDINSLIKSTTLKLRRKHKLKLPDAIIAATAITLDIPLLTSDKGFKTIEGLTLILFEI